jgi:hypothetical protein
MDWAVQLKTNACRSNLIYFSKKFIQNYYRYKIIKKQDHNKIPIRGNHFS